jgi:hypothetical protein
MTFGNPFGLALYDKQQRQAAVLRARVIGPSSLEGSGVL